MKSFFLVILGTATLMAQKPIFTTAKTTSARVYYTLAELSQEVSVNLPIGITNVIVKNVATRIDAESVQVSTPASVTVLSIRTTDNLEFSEEKSEIPKSLKDSLNMLRKKISRTEGIIQHKEKTTSLLDKNSEVYTKGSNTQGIDASEYADFVEYYEAKNTQLSDSIAFYTEKLEYYKTLWDKLEKRKKEKTQPLNSLKMLLIQVMNSKEGKVAMRLTYPTAGASWVPSYELNCEKDAIEGVYKAQISQNTGINWENVKLSLASGNPVKRAEVPNLSTWFLRYKDNTKAMNARKNLKTERIAAMLSVQNDEVSDADENSVQLAQSSISDFTSIDETPINVSFDIEIPYTINSNGKPHNVALKQLKIPTFYKYYAVPKKLEENFLIAEVLDYGKYDMLSGEAQLYLENTFVGKTFLNLSQISDTLQIPIGNDPKVSVKRELIADKTSDKLISSKRERVYAYNIVVQNNKKVPISIKLEDQYPISTDKGIEVTLLEKSNASEDKETGILSWQLSLKPGETAKRKLIYKVSSAKDKTLETNP